MIVASEHGKFCPLFAPTPKKKLPLRIHFESTGKFGGNLKCYECHSRKQTAKELPSQRSSSATGSEDLLPCSAARGTAVGLDMSSQPPSAASSEVCSKIKIDRCNLPGMTFCLDSVSVHWGKMRSPYAEALASVSDISASLKPSSSFLKLGFLIIVLPSRQGPTSTSVVDASHSWLNVSFFRSRFPKPSSQEDEARQGGSDMINFGTFSCSSDRSEKAALHHAPFSILHPTVSLTAWTLARPISHS